MPTRRDRGQGLLLGLAGVALVAGCGQATTNVGQRPASVEERSADPQTVVSGTDGVLILVNRGSSIEIRSADGATSKKLGSVAASGKVRDVAGAMTNDGRVLDLAIDTCPDGLSGADPEWPWACTGSSALTRVAVDTTTWSAVFDHPLDSSSLSSVARAEMAFSFLAGDPLLSIVGTRSIAFHGDSETVLPAGCGVGDVLYRVPGAGAEPVSTTTANPNAGQRQAPRIERFDAGGVAMEPLALPAGPVAITEAKIACSADSVYAMVTSDLPGAPAASADNSVLYRLDDGGWSASIARGRNGYFRAPTSPTPFMDAYFTEVAGATRVIADRRNGVIRRGDAPDAAQLVVMQVGGELRIVTVSPDRRTVSAR